jgi:hypothetical protein
VTTPPSEHKAGYGRPPLKSRWKKGHSGNPRTKANRQSTALEIIDRLLLTPVTLTLDGETGAVPALEAIVSQLQRKELSGSARATRVLLKYKEFAARRTEKRLDLVFVDSEYTRAISNLASGGNSDE